jgi:hypothetical protein
VGILPPTPLNPLDMLFAFAILSFSFPPIV